MDKIKQGMRRRLTRYGDDEFALFLRKSLIKGLGYGDAALDKPVIGIINTASDFNSCHGNVDELVQCAKAGVLAAGALPLALVQSGDRICLDAAARRLELLVSDDELARRRAALQLPVTAPNRGYGKLFHDHVVQAPGGVDFDFLQGVDTTDADAGV